MVEILGLAADIDQAVDRTRPAEHTAARIEDSAAVDAGVGLGLEAPGQRRVIEKFQIAGGDMDQRIPVAAAGFKQDNAVGRILGETVGQDAAGRAGADDDVVRLHVRRPPYGSFRCRRLTGYSRRAHQSTFRGEDIVLAIDYIKRDGVAYITLNNPGKANILDKPTSDEISAAWIDLWEDRDIRCAILTGAGDRHFCGGHNLAPRENITEEEREYLRTQRIFWPLAGTVHGQKTGVDGRYRRPLSAGLEAGDRRGERLGGRGRAVHPAVVVPTSGSPAPSMRGSSSR